MHQGPGWGKGCSATYLNLPQDIQAFSDLPKHHVLAVQPICLITGQEELGAIGVWAGVGHGKEAWGENDLVSSLHLLPALKAYCADCRQPL
jgi:hypothetical protein